ncbi:REM2- and Rab-like small GTPase 1 [Trichoplax sp. H2]|nr:REM2- and Rab-like small GTPase 1 [Trichoplax sp. H2]|eukprot:RDD44184.1 REM2- and Rab-like small GTPase 1 [Trichoplax sp. H2]
MMELSPGKLIEHDWYESNQGREFFNCLLRKQKRRQFGVLERPTFPLGMSSEIQSYKLFLYGKAGVGKTSLICKLCGLDIPQIHHETPGLQTSTIYWPAKLVNSNEVITFKFILYDVGEFALKKYNHFLPACIEKVDAVIFTFSFVDRASFDDLTNSVDNLALPEKSTLKIVVGTKYPILTSRS